MQKNENSGLYVTFNRLNKELNLFENRFYAVTANKSKNPVVKQAMEVRNKAELYCYYQNLLAHVNSKIEGIETFMLEKVPEINMLSDLPYSIPIQSLSKKLVYYPENKVFLIEEMSVEEINREDAFIKKLME